MFAFSVNCQAALNDEATLDGVKYRVISDSTADASIAKTQESITILPYAKIKGHTYKVVTLKNSDLKFKKTETITSITLPNTIKVISYYALCYTGISSITIPNSVEEIGDKAFCSCRKLKTIIIPSSVKKMGVDVFESCTSLKEVKIPNSVKEMGAGSFAFCFNINKITLPDQKPIMPTKQKFTNRNASAKGLGINYNVVTEIRSNSSDRCPFWVIEDINNENYTVNASSVFFNKIIKPMLPFYAVMVFSNLCRTLSAISPTIRFMPKSTNGRRRRNTRPQPSGAHE